MKFINFKNKKIFIAGKNGLLGSAIYKVFRILRIKVSTVE